MTGTVKWFSDEKGYGFLTADGHKDVFVHYTAIEGTGRRKLDKGDAVEFDVAPNPKRDNALQAENVRIVEPFYVRR